MTTSRDIDGRTQESIVSYDGPTRERWYANWIQCITPKLHIPGNYTQ
jgi:hypothetical protein